MDSREDAWDYDSMDHAEVNRQFVEDLLAELCGSGQWSVVSGQATVDGVQPGSRHPHPGPLPEGEGDEAESLLVLDLGTGTAQIPIELCQRNEDIRVMAADAAVSMLDLARLNVEISGLRERIQLDQADAKRMAYRDLMFDSVISNSIVHHIPEPRGVFGESIRVTKRGGLLFFRDLLRPVNEEEVQRLVDTYAASANDHQRSLFRDSLHAALTLDEVRALVAEFGFAAETARQTSDRHWTWSARRG
jgi:SAM-dependent methyltransferase